MYILWLYIYIAYNNYIYIYYTVYIQQFLSIRHMPGADFNNYAVVNRYSFLMLKSVRRPIDLECPKQEILNLNS